MSTSNPREGEEEKEEGSQLVSVEEGEENPPFGDPEINEIELEEEDKNEQDKNKQDPLIPFFPSNMASAAEQFLGADRRNTPRDIAAVHTIDMIMKKMELMPLLDAKALNKLHEKPNLAS
eukprot:3585673-Ditylum_brightwellii.AAC.2